MANCPTVKMIMQKRSLGTKFVLVLWQGLAVSTIFFDHTTIGFTDLQPSLLILYGLCTFGVGCLSVASRFVGLSDLFWVGCVIILSTVLVGFETVWVGFTWVRLVSLFHAFLFAFASLKLYMVR